MARVAIIGANGQLGTDCLAAFRAAGHAVTAVNHDRMEVSDADLVDSVLGEIAPDVIVNTAAMHNGETCEAEPELAYRVNAVGARNLAIVSRRLGCRLLHVSTDYVFDGKKGKPYREDDLPLPLSVYGASKLSGEHLMLAEYPDSVVVRTSGLYGRSECRAKQGGLNFVQRMLQLARDRGRVQVVTDEHVTPTYTADLAGQLVALSGSGLSGVVHATSQGECSWFEFAREIFALADVPVRLDATTAAAFPSKVRRPPYSVLDNSRLREAGIDGMPHWRDSLLAYMKDADILDDATAQPQSR